MPLSLVTLATMTSQRGGDDEQGLDELLMGAARALRRRWSAGLGELAGLELSPHEARALRTIGHHGPTRLGVVAEHLRIAPRSATDVVDRLESRGLVERAADPSDRRAMTVSLTPRGAEVLARTDALRREGAAEFFGALTPAQRHTLSSLLAKLDPEPGPRGQPRMGP
jgi:DNA-binding MarR family transcriptional regulator